MPVCRGGDWKRVELLDEDGLILGGAESPFVEGGMTTPSGKSGHEIRGSEGRVDLDGIPCC